MNIRRLEEVDHDLGYLELLAGLTKVGNITKDKWVSRFKEIKNQSLIQIWVIHDTVTDQIIGTGTLLLEPKFIHECGLVGHIEDIVVSKKIPRSGLGKSMISFLLEKAKEEGCYKTILDCTEETVGFYQKCGMLVKGTQMAVYYSE